MALCSNCRTTFADDLDDYWDVYDDGVYFIKRPFPLGEALKQGVDSGCYICACVHENQTLGRGEDSWVQAWSEMHAPTGRNPFHRLSIDYTTNDTPEDTTFSGAEFVVRLDPGIDQMLGDAASQSRSTGSEEHMRLARHWLSDCITSHRQCKRNKHPSWYPTRLLRIDADKLSLIQSAEQDLDEPYATLSHCWGRGWFECLTMENLADMEFGISRDTLPPTFRDAVSTAERLEIRLLWIDCYCIIQCGSTNDAVFTEDKMVEIAKMKDVYMNAMINIGAAHGSGPQAGCFVRRKDMASKPSRRFEWKPESSRPRETFALREYYTNRRQLQALFKHQSLFTRGWVMQERFLTPRMLHFTDSQVYWECATVGVANERCAEGISEPEPLDMTSFVYPAFTLDLDEADHYRLWGELVHDYSSLALTQPAQDKLVAIGAIAARLAEKSEDEYVAGVFRRDLLRSLCWLPWLKTAEAVERLTNSNTPSWSWASMHCPLRFGHVHINDETMAKLVDVSIKLRDRNNSFGAVNSGKLLLRGRLLQAQLTARLPSDERQRPKFVIDIGGAIETGLLRDAFRDLEELYGFTGSHYFLPLFWGLSLARRRLSIQDSLALRAKDGNFNLEDHVVRGLLLQKQPDQSFKRIHMLFSVSSEILQAWAATTEELITLV